MTEVEWHGFQLLSLGSEGGRGDSPITPTTLVGAREVRAGWACGRGGAWVRGVFWAL